MKRLLIPLLASLALPTAVNAWWGKYNSRYDANEACEIWMMKGFHYTYIVMQKRGFSDRTFHGEKYHESGLISLEYLEFFSQVERDREEIVETTKTGFSRSCLEEKETKQFIGREKSCLKKKEYSVEEWEKLFELKSCEKRKYFKY